MSNLPNGLFPNCLWTFFHSVFEWKKVFFALYKSSKSVLSKCHYLRYVSNLTVYHYNSSCDLYYPAFIIVTFTNYHHKAIDHKKKILSITSDRLIKSSQHCKLIVFKFSLFFVINLSTNEILENCNMIKYWNYSLNSLKPI